MLLSGLSSISNYISDLIGGFYSASLLPNTANGNANSGDVSFSQNLNRFKIMHLRPKLEFLRIIDDYFTRYGYKINKVILPNIVGRKTWNYVEIGSSESIGNGNVPSEFMETINNACRRGVTIWHNASEIGEFSLDNSIVN